MFFRGGIEDVESVVTDIQVISSEDISNFPTTRIQGHAGKLIFGKIDGIDVVLLKGRYHFYEGHTARDVVFPYFVLNAMGVKSVITTNAVGGIRHDLDPGDIMLVTDHINYMGTNPLIDIAMERKTNQFTNMTMPYDLTLQNIAKEEAQQLEIELKDGVYISTTGPSYETKSEIKMFRSFGADTVGMSSVFEVIACNFLNMRVLTFSCIANPAADRHKGNMTHDEVIEAMGKMGPKLSELIIKCSSRILSLEN